MKLIDNTLRCNILTIDVIKFYFYIRLQPIYETERCYYVCYSNVCNC